MGAILDFCYTEFEVIMKMITLKQQKIKFIHVINLKILNKKTPLGVLFRF